MDTYPVHFGKVNSQAVLGCTMHPYVYHLHHDFCPDSRIKCNSPPLSEHFPLALNTLRLAEIGFFSLAFQLLKLEGW